jgi:hypothetical protein
MNAYPFSIFKRADRPYYLVSFKGKDGKYLPAVSTKKKAEQEAVQIAFQWLRDGVPQKNKNSPSLNVRQISTKNMARKIESLGDAEIFLQELKRRKILKSYVLAETEKAVSFIRLVQ